MIKSLPANEGDRRESGLIPGSGRSPEGRHGNLVFLPRKCHGQRSLVGYSPWGHKDLNMTEHACTHCFLSNKGCEVIELNCRPTSTQCRNVKKQERLCGSQVSTARDLNTYVVHRDFAGKSVLFCPKPDVCRGNLNLTSTTAVESQTWMMSLVAIRRLTHVVWFLSLFSLFLMHGGEKIHWLHNPSSITLEFRQHAGHSDLNRKPWRA